MTYKFSIQGFPDNWSDTSGLLYRSYSVYSGSSDGPLPASLVSSSLRYSTGSSTQISSFPIGVSQTFVWRGYFEPDSTRETWQFRTTSDDGSYLWLDDNAELAVATLDPDNAIVKNGGDHGLQTVASSNVTLSSSFYYAITLIAGNNAGTGSVTLEWSDDGGSTWSSSGATYLSHDSRFPDGFGADVYPSDADPNTDYWLVGPDSGNGSIGYAANADRTTWTFYNKGAGNASSIRAAYGKDGNGRGVFVMSNSNSSSEIRVSSIDITDGQEWTGVNLPTGSQRFCDCLTWSDDSTSSTSGVWLAGRRNGKVARSTDGAVSFTETVLPGANGDPILGIAGNGSGKFVTGQDERLYISTDDGDTFASSTPFTAEVINGVAYTSQTWIVTYTKSGEDNLFARTAADSDLTTWSSEQDLGIAKPLDRLDQNDPGPVANIAAYSGHVVIVPNRVTSIARLDVNGTSISNLNSITLSIEKPRDIATDGLVYMMGTEGGDIYESTDGGASFTKTVDDVEGTGTSMNAVAAAVHLPIQDLNYGI